MYKGLIYMMLFRRHRDVDEVFVSKCFAYFRIIGIKILVERVGDYREFDPGAFIGQISTLEAHQPIGVSVFVLFRNVVLYAVTSGSRRITPRLTT